jgi:molybdopterin-guanine dinucleotide biosynthesis protein A
MFAAENQTPRRRGAIVLCGGQSRRMGLPKATLPMGDEAMLQRVVRLVRPLVETVCVVAARDQELPELSPDVLLAQDRRPERGPLEGLAAGLAALAGKADAVYATSCDVPLLVSAFVERMFELLEQNAIAVPVDGRFHHPLAAVYRTSVLGEVERLLAADRLRPVYLFENVPTRHVPVDELRDVDPDLDSLENLNHPEGYFSALRRAGLPVSDEIRRRLRQPGT